jgi:hypothetical protein
LDHVIARSEGGALTDPKNLVACCARCNSRKQAQGLQAFCYIAGLSFRATKQEISKRTSRKVRV